MISLSKSLSFLSFSDVLQNDRFENEPAILQLRKTNTMNESIGNIWIQVQFQVPVVRNWTMFWMFVQMNTCQHMIFYLLFVVDDSWIRGRDVRILLNRNVSGSLLPSLTFSLGVFALCLLAILCQSLCVLAVHFQLYTDIHTHLYYSHNKCLYIHCHKYIMINYNQFIWETCCTDARMANDGKTNV